MFKRLIDPFVTLSPDRIVLALLPIGFIAAAVASGAIIASENVVMIALVGGALLSAVLLGAPSVALWVVLVGVLLVSGPLIFHFPALERIRWLFSVLGLFLLVAAFLHGGLARRRNVNPVPVFIWIAITLVIYAVASMLWAEVPLNQSGAGARRTIHYWGIMFALALIAFSDRTVFRWILFVCVLGLIQWPYAIYQRVVVHPTLQFSGAFDSIAGTFEVSTSGFGGSTGALAFMLCLLIGGAFAAYREKLIGVPILAACVAALMLPIAVGETNVVFIWLPLVLAIVYADQLRRRPILFLTGSAVFAVLLVAFATVYLVTQQAHQGAPVPFETRLKDTYEYNFGSRGYANASDLNRSNVIPYWFKHNGLEDPVRATFGHGIGSAYADRDFMTPLFIRHSYRSISLVAVAEFLWELGLVGATLFLAMIAFAIRSAFRLVQTVRPGVDRAVARSLLVGNVLLLSLVFYDSAFITTASQQVVAVLVLGLTAWMERRSQPCSPSGARTGAA